MATLTVQKPGPAGAVLIAQGASAGGDVFPNDGNAILYVRNISGSTITVTVSTPAAPKGLGINELSLSVGNGQHRVLGPFDPRAFNNASGNVSVSYSATTNLLVAVIGR